jgi:hypothetical protein
MTVGPGGETFLVPVPPLDFRILWSILGSREEALTVSSPRSQGRDGFGRKVGDVFSCDDVIG